MIELDDNFRAMKDEIYTHMLATRGEKYKWFLSALKAVKFVSMNQTRGILLESYYTLMRYVDDIVDGDASLPQRFQSPVEFVEEKISFAKHPTTPRDSADYLMLYCFELANKLGQDISCETKDILSSLLFDAKRYGKKIIFPEKELSYHFHLLDIRGTIKGALKVFGEEPSNYSLLEPLGLACRIFYNLRDYDEDMRAGLVNISAEDCQRFRISENDLENRLSNGVKQWFVEQSNQGMQLLAQHRENVSKGDFGLLARITFPIVYEHSSGRYFKNVLSG